MTGVKFTEFQMESALKHGVLTTFVLHRLKSHLTKTVLLITNETSKMDKERLIVQVQTQRL